MKTVSVALGDAGTRTGLGKGARIRERAVDPSGAQPSAQRETNAPVDAHCCSSGTSRNPTPLQTERRRLMLSEGKVPCERV